MTSPRLRILGPVEFFDGHSWLPIPAAKQRSLLASLIVHGNRVVPTGRLVAELWPDRPPASASGLLAGYVWRLRKQLVGVSLLTRAPGYQLAVSPGALDVHEYERLVAAGRGAVAADNLEEGADLFRRALAIWRDVPLTDVAMTLTMLAERARLEESRLATVEACVDAEIRLGHAETLLPELKQLVLRFPLRERLRGHLMLVLYRCGHQADALAAYRDLRKLLVGELGIEPSKPLRELLQRILAEDPDLTGPVTSLATSR